MDSNQRQTRFTTIEPWNVTEEQFRPEDNEIGESIFSLANEYMGCRGNFEEGFAGETLPGCYIGGIYVKERQAYPWKRKGFPTFVNSMINTVNWLEINVEVDGESLDLATSAFADYRRSLDLRQGLLSRRLVFVTRSGVRTRLGWERLVSHDDPHLGAIRFSLTALGHRRPVTVTFALDGRRENRDFATSRVHTRMLRQGEDAADAFLLTNVMTTGQYTIHRMSVESPAIPGVAGDYQAADKRVALTFAFTPEADREYLFEKRVAVWTSRDAGHPYGLIPKEEDRTEVDPVREEEIARFLVEKSRGTLAAEGNRYGEAREAHARHVSRLWADCDIEIEGDPASQQGIRYCMFQLLGAYRGRDPLLNIGPKGYSGECYNGRTFWDTESYCLPFYLFTHPDSARKLLEYRHRTLPAARARAREFRYQGAMYPMTTLDGTEDTPVWEYAIGEIHINAAIAYAVFVHARVTGDPTYLYERGVDVLVEVARFFASRCAFIPYRNGYAINRVMGPNEYGQCVNNNWYTNYMAKWVLEYALQVVGEMREGRPEAWEAMAARLAFDPAETGRWGEIAGKLILPYDPERQVFLENDFFLSLDPLSREELDRERDIPIERKWTIEKYQKYQIIKQPDVLLAFFFFRDRFTLEQKKNHYRFYEQRCTHGSSLSPAVHSILACEVGRFNQAFEYYLWSSRLDLDNLNNNTQEGLHISSMAGAWMNIVCGFGGFAYSGESLEFAPILPERWRCYSFKLVYRGRTIEAAVDRERVSLRLRAGDPVRARLYGQEVEISSRPFSAPLSPAYRNRPSLKAVLFDLDGVIIDTSRFHDLATLTRQDILPGIPVLLDELRAAGIKTAIVSVSRNTDYILERLELRQRFDAVVTGNDTARSKPDPEGMRLAARRVGVAPESCVVVEAAAAGLEAAIAAGMRNIGIGDKTLLHRADYTLPSTRYLSLEKIQALF